MPLSTVYCQMLWITYLTFETLQEVRDEDGKDYGGIDDIFRICKANWAGVWKKKEVWTKLMEECLKRQHAGTLTAYAKTWPVDKFKATLLQNDGAEVPLTKVLRKQLQVTDKNDQQEDTEVDDQEEAVDDEEEEREGEDEEEEYGEYGEEKE